jgi:heat shock protein HtpX
MINDVRPVLVYDRIRDNRRDTMLLLGAFALIMAPAALYLNEYLTATYAFGRVMTGSAPVNPDPADLDRVIRQGRVLGWAIMLGVLFFAGWLQYRKGDRLALRLAGAKRLPPGTEPELRRTVESLSIASGLPVPDLYTIESSSPNVFSVGRDPDHASIVLSRGTLNLLGSPELESVLAYEFAQIGNYDTSLNTVVGAIVWALSLPLRLSIGAFKRLYGIHPFVGIGCAVWLIAPLVIVLPFGVVLVIEMAKEDLKTALGFGLLLILPFYAYAVTPLAGVLIRSSVASERILQADSEAVLLAGNPAALARALEKMSAAGPDLAVAPALTQLMFLDPRGEASSGWRAFFRAHPPVGERITVLAGMDTSISEAMLERARYDGEKFGHEQVYGADAESRRTR